MKKIIPLLAFIVFLSFARADAIIITEVLYDPLNESGGEAVELFNPTGSPVNVGGWVIATESSSTDATIPANTIMMPESYFLVADAGWNFISEVKADYQEALTLANNDAGVALINNGTVIDAVGWGNAANIGSGLFEGIPASPASEGESLQRKLNSSNYIDSGNNSADFSSGTPAFRNSSPSSGFQINVYAIVTSSSISVDAINITVDDDASSAGIQILPLPKSNRTFSVKALVRSDSGMLGTEEVRAAINSSLFALARTVELNSTASIFEGNLSMPFYSLPGNYTINITAKSSANSTATKNTSFEFLSLLSAEIDSSSVTFAAAPGAFSEVIGDNDMSSQDKITIRNTGNSMLNMQVSASDLSYGNYTIPADKMQFSFDSSFSGSLSGYLNYTRQAIGINLVPGASSTKMLSLRLNVPTNSPSGNYTGKIFLGAVS